MKGILFRTEMNLEIREDRKTQTRRLVKLPSSAAENSTIEMREEGGVWNPYFHKATSGLLFPVKPKYRVGEVVYLKEGWLPFDEDHVMDGNKYAYRVDCKIGDDGDRIRQEYGYKWRSAMFMPESAARTFLEITSVRVERLQDISEEDAKAEGISDNEALVGQVANPYRTAYADLWNSISKPPHDWAANPWVFVYAFKKVERPKGGK